MNNASGQISKEILQTPTTKRKIGFISAMLLVISSSIGAGIFIKNHEILNDVHGAIIYAIIAWMIAIIGIISLALCLGEICSGSGNVNNQGLVGWVKKFCNKFLYNGTKNYMSYLHFPVSYFILPIYLVMIIQQAFGFSLDWYVILLIALLISAWFIVVSGISHHAANIQNWVTIFIKFLPIFLAIIGGFVVFFLKHDFNNINWINFYDENYQDHTKLFSDQSAILGIVCAIPAVFFAFDGFYAAAGLQTSMHEPHRVSQALSIGISAVSFFDMLVTLALILSTKSGQLINLDIVKWLIIAAQICIAIGILGIINGYAVSSGRYYNDLIEQNSFPFASKLRKYLKPNSFVLGSIVCLVVTFIFFIIFGLIGTFAFINTSHYGLIPGWDNINYGNDNVLCLYSFCDVIANWNAVLAFVCILFAIIGCLYNRKTKKIKVKQFKLFPFFSILCICIVGFSMSFCLVKACGDLYWILHWYNQPEHLDNTNNPILINDVIGGFVQIGMFIEFIGIMFIPALVKHKFKN